MSPAPSARNYLAGYLAAWDSPGWIGMTRTGWGS